MIYMLFALLVFVVTVGCIVGIRWGISYFFLRIEYLHHYETFIVIIN